MLFNYPANETINWLPQDGRVHYYGKIFGAAEANHFLDYLLREIGWNNDEAFIFGKLIVTARKVAWHGNEAFEYEYSNRTKRALPWTPELLRLKAQVEAKTGETFNACLLNLYHNGGEGMAWHSDGEKELKKDGAIASLSFGAERRFSFKHKKTAETVSLQLEHGSLLTMLDKTQMHWLHRLPPTKKQMLPRVNLTFRTMGQG